MKHRDMDQSTCDKRLMMTERRLKNLDRRGKSLLDIAAEAVISNLYWFIFNIEDERVIQLRNLPNVLRNMLKCKFEVQSCCYNGDGDEFRKRFRALLALLMSSVKQLNLTPLMTFCPEEAIHHEMPNVIQAIARKAPNLTSLQMNCEMELQPNFEDMERAIEMLGHNKELLKLEATFMSLSLSQVIVLCRDKLPKLQYLVINKLTYELFQLEDVKGLKQSLKNLRVFLYEEMNDEVPSEFTRFCLRHLPNLKVVRQFVDRPRYGTLVDTTVTEFPVETSALQHLRIKPMNLGPIHLAYPEVTDLMVDWPKCDYAVKDIGVMLWFTKVKCLNLNCIDRSNILNRFLSSYGGQLHTLICTDTRYESKRCIQVTFHNIFRCCPNLEVLVLGEIVDVLDASEKQTKFAKLRIFQWNEDLHLLRNIILSNILAAPDLEEFTGVGNQYDLEDLKLVSQKIVKGEILGKLTSITFKMEDLQLIPPRTDTDIFDAFVPFAFALHDLVKNACAHLPNLTHVEVRHFFYIDPTKLETIMENYSGSHVRNLLEEDDAACLEFIGDKTIGDFLGVFNRRKYVHIPSE